MGAWGGGTPHHSEIGGMGAFSVSGLDPAAFPDVPDRRRQREQRGEMQALLSWAPTETRASAGFYTGVKVRGQPPDDPRLSALTLKNRTVLDPQNYGGVLVRMNSGHGSSANVHPLDIGDGCLMVAALPAAPFEELLWDYVAVTTEADDPLLEVACRCQGRPLTYRWIKVEGRECTGCMVELVEERKKNKKKKKKEMKTPF